METWKLVAEGAPHEEPLTSPAWRSPLDGSAFTLAGPNALASVELDRARHDFARYAALLPVREPFVTLGGGMTPLVPGRLAGRAVWFKLDMLLPTGSFKDRGAAVVVNHMTSLGVRKVIVDSSGNAAAAMAAYAAAADMDCVVYAPADASPGKLVQARAYGAEVVPVAGSRDAVAEAAQSAADADADAYYSSHNWSPIFAEGVKTWALEVWEQLGGQSPAAAFVPTGGGSAFIGAWRGFGATDGMPQLVAAQPLACAPIVAAFETGAERADPVQPQPTLAEGARIANPVRDRQLLAAIPATRGWAAAVSEDELIAALRELWSQGIYAEPTAALGAAAFRQAVSNGRPLPGGDTVILITGNGLKATESISTLLNGAA